MDSTGPRPPVIIVIDEIALHSAMRGPHAESPDDAAAWLLAQYDAISNSDIWESVNGRRVQVQPMITFKSVMTGGHQMRVRESDYEDPGRWWL